MSPVLGKIRDADSHPAVDLTDEDRERLITWMDTYGQRLGSFSEVQEARLVRLRESWGEMLAD